MRCGSGLVQCKGLGPGARGKDLASVVTFPTFVAPKFPSTLTQGGLIGSPLLPELIKITPADC